MDNAMKEKLLNKLMEFFSMLPDSEDLKDGGVDEAKEGEPPLDGKVDMLAVDASPMGDDKKQDLKGFR